MPDPTASSLDVTVFWRGDAIAGRHLEEDGAVTVGAAEGSLAPIPCAAAGCEAFEVARIERGVCSVRVPAGAIASLRGGSGAFSIVFGPTEVCLARGDALDFPLGDFRLHITADAPERIAAAPARTPRGTAHLVLAAAAHAVILALAAQAAGAKNVEDTEDDRAETLQKLMVSAEQRARAPRPPTEDTIGDGRGRDIAHRDGDGRAGGARAAGREGSMGDRKSQAKGASFALPGKRKEQEVAVSRAEALSDAAAFGIIGVAGDGSPSPSPWASFADVAGRDALYARGPMFGEDLGIGWGTGGLGLSGIGEGGGGRGEGIGLGTIGTIGVYGLHGGGLRPRPRYRGGHYFGGYYSGGYGSHRPPRVGCSRGAVHGPVGYAGITQLLGCQSARVRACYEKALETNPKLAGKINVHFVIGRDGAVIDAASGGSTIDHPELVACVVTAFKALSFPQPEAGIVTVSYAVVLSQPPDEEP